MWAKSDSQRLSRLIPRIEGQADAEVVVTYTLPADRMVRDDAPAVCP